MRHEILVWIQYDSMWFKFQLWNCYTERHCMISCNSPFKYCHSSIWSCCHLEIYFAMPGDATFFSQLGHGSTENVLSQSPVSKLWWAVTTFSSFYQLTIVHWSTKHSEIIGIILCRCKHSYLYSYIIWPKIDGLMVSKLYRNILKMLFALLLGPWAG